MFTNYTQGLSLCPHLAPGGDLRVCGLCFEVLLYFIHLPILLPTSYCLAAGIAGGWHLLPGCSWCGRDLWTTRRPVGVRDRCRGLQCCTLSQILCDILYVSTTFAKRQNYVGSGISPWWLCLSGTVCYAPGRDLWVWNNGTFVSWVAPHFLYGKCGMWQLFWSTFSKEIVIELCALSKTLLPSCPLQSSSLGLQHGCITVKE